MSVVKLCKCNIFETSEFPEGISSILLLQLQLQASSRKVFSAAEKNLERSLIYFLISCLYCQVLQSSGYFLSIFENT